MRAEEVIATHGNTDFDAFAATIAARRLYPDAVIAIGALNRNVREFASLHGEELPIVAYRSLDMASVRRLVVVDTADCTRLAELGDLCGRDGVEVVVFDHHESENPERPPFVKGENWVLSRDGAQSTSMLYLLRERGIEVSRLAATIFALGIHEDTGSLTYPRTTIRDADMLAVSMRLGASQALIERYLHSALTSEQRLVLMEMVDLVRLDRVRGLDAWPRRPWSCCATSTRRRSTSCRTSTGTSSSRSCSRRASRTCWSTAPPGSRSGWRRTSRRTTSAR
jgi:tRNA nucleotidyltransferase (CCA-adding enzyme)